MLRRFSPLLVQFVRFCDAELWDCVCVYVIYKHMYMYMYRDMHLYVHMPNTYKAFYIHTPLCVLLRRCMSVSFSRSGGLKIKEKFR